MIDTRSARWWLIYWKPIFKICPRMPAEKEHPSPLFPLRWSERYWRSSSVKVKGTIGLRSDWCRTTVPLRPWEGEEWGRGALFQLSPNFAIDKKPTLPLHSIFINDQLCFWHQTFSTNSSSTISSSILSTTRRGELYLMGTTGHQCKIVQDSAR